MREIDYRKFWEVNSKCMDLGSDIPRVPVSIYLNGDWICDHLQLDCVRYYTDYRYQQEMRKKCSLITERELSYKIAPEIDFGVVLDASIYGGRVLYEDKATPVLSPAIQDPEEIDGLIDRIRSADPLECGLVPRYLEWRENIRAEFGVTLTYGDSLKGCATMLGQILGITNFLTWIMTDPEQIKKMVDCWYDTSIRYLEAMRSATGYTPKGRFSFASDLAGMLSPAVYDEFIKESEGKLYQRFAGGPDDKRYYHADYHMLHLLPSLKEIGVSEVNIDPYIDPAQILQVMPEAVVYGQIPPTDILLYGTPEQVRDCVRRDIQQAGPSKKLIVSTAGSINPGTSFENLRAICEAVEEYGYIY